MKNSIAYLPKDKQEDLKGDIDALIPKVELLRDITHCICEARSREYGERY